jgi:hypothetical protein
MKDFLDKKLKKRTSLETSLLAALEVDDDEFTSGDDNAPYPNRTSLHLFNRCP